MEKGAYRFYQGAMDHSPDSPFAQVAGKLVELEHKHAEVVYGFLNRYVPGESTASFEELFDQLDGDLIEGGESVEKVLERLKSSPGQESMLFADLALEMEYRAYDLYRNIGEELADADEKNVFMSLAEQEKGHIRLIARQLEKCLGC
jgi:hypothetical protein